MDGKRFDDLTRAMARNASRRSVLKGAIVSLAAGLAPFAGLRRARGQATTASCQLFVGRACDDANPCGSNCPALGCCEGVCADLNSDPANCTECGRGCDTGYCVDRACCPAGNLLCGVTCVDGTSDAANCGACGATCAPGQPCIGGVCSCASPAIACGGACVDPTADPANCGGCGHACDAGQLCCSGVCTAIKTDGTNCGACGVVCPAGLPNCCGGACVDGSSDPANCGECAIACRSDELCQSGVCAGATATATTSGGCANGSTACGDVCTDVSSDPANCGGCGTACGAGQACAGGACQSGAVPTSTPTPGPCTVAPMTTGHSVKLSLASPGGQLTFDQSIVPSQTDAGASTSILVQQAGVMVLQADATTTPTGSTVRVLYGSAIGGIKEADFTSDGKTVQGAIDGRAIAPFASGSDPAALAFADGSPLPKVKIKASLKTAINRLLQQAGDAVNSCNYPELTPGATPVSGLASGGARLLLAIDALTDGQPGHRSLPDISGACLSCEGVCAVAQGVCIGVAAGACAGTLFFYGVCLALAVGGCGIAAYGCVAACHVPNFPCCPVTCGHGIGSCCNAGETCLDPGNNLCCSEGLVACNAKSCCPPGDACLSDGTCCPDGQATCLDVCCHPGETCQYNNSVCCPQKQVVCLGVCCGPGQVCTANGDCCAKESVCGDACCNTLEGCIDASRSLCCGGFAKACAGECCALNEECVNGSCCPLGQRCGNVCCPSHTSCVDRVTGACAACAQPGWVACQALGEPPCCPTLNQCCANGQCCDIGQPCGVTANGWVCGAGIVH